MSAVTTPGSCVLALLGGRRCWPALGLVAARPRRIWPPVSRWRCWPRPRSSRPSPTSAVDGPRSSRPLLVAGRGLLAVVGGGPVTARVFALVDRGAAAPHDSMDRAGQVLRGGAWIGALERVAVFAALVAGWPEGLAVVLALKGLGRYPELRGRRGGQQPATAERFIIGTFTSVLWAAACAGHLPRADR